LNPFVSWKKQAENQVTTENNSINSTDLPQQLS